MSVCNFNLSKLQRYFIKIRKSVRKKSRPDSTPETVFMAPTKNSSTRLIIVERFFKNRLQRIDSLRMLQSCWQRNSEEALNIQIQSPLSRRGRMFASLLIREKYLRYLSADTSKIFFLNSSFQSTVYWFIRLRQWDHFFYTLREIALVTCWYFIKRQEKQIR